MELLWHRIRAHLDCGDKFIAVFILRRSVLCGHLYDVIIPITKFWGFGLNLIISLPTIRNSLGKQNPVLKYNA